MQKNTFQIDLNNKTSPSVVQVTAMCDIKAFKMSTKLRDQLGNITLVLTEELDLTECKDKAINQKYLHLWILYAMIFTTCGIAKNVRETLGLKYKDYDHTYTYTTYVNSGDFITPWVKPMDLIDKHNPIEFIRKFPKTIRNGRLEHVLEMMNYYKSLILTEEHVENPICNFDEELVAKYFDDIAITRESYKPLIAKLPGVEIVYPAEEFKRYGTAILDEHFKLLFEKDLTSNN